MKKVRETDESLNKGRDSFCLGECVLEGRFRFRGEILNMPQRKPHSFAAEWNSGKTCSPSSRGEVNGAAFMMTLMLLITPFMAGEVSAQCVATQDCASLGYTEASCPNGGIKCPFGTMWSCKAEATAPKANCEVGWILYSDKTCTSTENRDITKTPIGVVFYKNPNGGGMALALKKLSGYKWLTENCSTLDECPSVYVNYGEFYNDFDSCGNTQKIVDFGDASRFPAAWAAHNYTTAGTKAGDWCLPSSGTLDLIMDNQNAILETLRNLNAYESYPFETFSSNLTVSSSSAGDLYIDPVCLSRSGSYYIISTCDNNIYTIGYVRPVIEF